MKAKLKSKQCQVPGCKQKWVCGTHPKGHMNKRLFVCNQHVDDDILWKLWGMRKPEKVRRSKSAAKNHKPKREGKAAWQKILDTWLEKGKYPLGNFMNPKRWEYWISIGGKKPEGDSRKFEKSTLKETLADFNTKVHPLLLHKMKKHKKSKSKSRGSVKPAPKGTARRKRN